MFGQAGPRVSSPADGFFVPYLTRVIGAKRAREMWMLCRRYTALEACCTPSSFGGSSFCRCGR
ncbi:MAG: hypothetical protein ACE5IZ_11100 [Dehalococcoidia bacterium]